jgi:hypothetical protein
MDHLASSPDALNAVSVETVRKELTEKGWAKIESLTAFLFSEQVPPSRRDQRWRHRVPVKARIAPSIITRSELEVFGLSMPRFCYRLYFEGVDAFVNIRRLLTFKAQLDSDPDAAWGARRTGLKEEEQHPRVLTDLPNVPVKDLLPDGGHSFIIADCLLQPPKRLLDLYFHFCWVDLFSAYGEAPEQASPNIPNRPRKALPFVQTVRFGGGLCAQACCFLATNILHHASNGVYGLAEITALASRKELKELLISGLDEYEMSAYFRNVSLTATPQISNPNINARHLQNIQDSDFKQCLHGYVASGMPVILLVDIARLAGVGVEGKAIYETNGYRLAETPIPQRHAVTVLGCSRWEDRGSGRFFAPSNSDCDFVFSDSATMPFMRASVEQLVQVGTWNQDSRSAQMRRPALLPVTPLPVKMPLLSWRTGYSSPWNYGLIEISKRNLLNLTDPTRREFILAQIGEVNSVRVARHFSPDFRDGLSIILQQVLPEQLRAQFFWQDEHWVWLECGEGVVIIWDAEMEPAGEPDPYDPSLYQRGIVQIIDQCVKLKITTTEGDVTFSPADAAEELQAEPSNPAHTIAQIEADRPINPNEKKIHVSAISSFAVSGAQTASSAWSQTVPTNFVEVYTCMQGDLPFFFRDSVGRKKGWNAVRVLEEQNGNAESPRRFADLLRSTFKDQQVIGFATFIPELMAPHKHVVERAQHALEFLIKTASLLKAEDHPFTIELVAGSRLHGVWQADTTEAQKAFAVNRLDPQCAIEMFLKRLEVVAGKAVAFPGVQLAVELEPGPLFVIAEHESLLRFCSRLEMGPYPNCRRTVGVNLDIPHWAFLSGINLKQINDPTYSLVRGRIIHAHISDHSKGHFCDHVVGLHHARKEFIPWLSFLKNLVAENRRPDSPRFSRFVSCEMEACKSSQFVKACVRTIQAWLAES